jgi:integrase
VDLTVRKAWPHILLYAAADRRAAFIHARLLVRASVSIYPVGACLGRASVVWVRRSSRGQTLGLPRRALAATSPVRVGQRCSLLSNRRRHMTDVSALDVAGRRRSPATMPGYHAGRPPRNKGIRYPADPPTVDEIVAVMRHTADNRHGFRLRAMIVVLWRAGLRIHEALALTEHDLDPRRGSVLVRSGKGGRRREVGMDEWG